MPTHTLTDSGKKKDTLTPEWKQPLQGASEHPTKATRVLIVDDSSSIRFALQDGLLKEGYHVCTAENGKKALAILQSTQPDFILSDVYMPEMDGIELCATLHEDPLYCQIPLVVMSTEKDAGNMRQMMIYGAAAFLIKPFKIEQLIITLKNITKQQKGLKEKEILHTQLLQTHKLESVGQLASGIAHEINTPTQFVSSNVGFLAESFTSIQEMVDTLLKANAENRLSSDILEQALEAADWPYLLKEIPLALQQSREGLSRVANLVRAMKEFSHPGGKEAKLVDINHLIETTVTVARNEWKYSAELQLNLAPDLPMVLCLASEMGQVLLNLLVNAAHAVTEKLGRTPEGNKGRITITTEVDAPFVLIHVADTGCGIPDSALSKVFEPFFTTKAVGKGTGQGLAIAYDVVTHKHGGTLSFVTGLGKGTTFTIRLPIRNMSSDEAE